MRKREGKQSQKRSQMIRFGLGLLVVIGMFTYLLSGLINLQLKQTETYAEQAESTRTKTITQRGKRGYIVDAESVILAMDENIYNVTFYKDPSATSKSQYYKFSSSILNTIEIVERNGGSMYIDFNVQWNEELQDWEFNFGSGVSETVLQTRESQWRSNNYLSATRYPTASDCVKQLKKKFRLVESEEELAEMRASDPDSGVDWILVDRDTMCKICAVFCEMQMNVFNSQPIVVAHDVSYETVIEVETRSMMLSGMEIAIGTKRVYPRSTLAAQVIGYVGKIPSQRMWATLKTQGYSYSDTIGRDGIESSMEEWLTQNSSARQGTRVVERDQMSRVVRELSYTEPQDGNTVKLTLRADYQEQAELAIAANVAQTRDRQEKYVVSDSWLEANKSDIATRNWAEYPLELAEHGCLIVLDMQDRVLAMANYPTYDLNALVNGGSEAIEILKDDRGLLLNYGIAARGTPGSIFKMVTGYGVLAEGELSPTEMITDLGYYKKYNSDESTAPKCWISEGYRWKHQYQTIVEGLSNSCNYFFYEMGSRLGEDRLYRYSSLFGLTSKTGIDLPGEVRSVVGCQNTLYDPTKGMSESEQDTSIPIIAYNAIKKHLRNCGASYNITYDDDRLNMCAKHLMDMAVNTAQGDWVSNIRTVLMEDLGMTKAMVYTQVVIGDTFNYMNEIKWGGSQTIMTAIGQSVTTLTPISVARYVCAIANGGYVYNVSIIDSIISPDGEIVSQRTPQLVNYLEYADEYLPLIRQGMAGVVDDGGTAGTHFKNWKYLSEMSAKTGTAQTTSIDLENNSWFVCFVPKEKPEIAIAVFIPHGLSGGDGSVAAKQFVEWYLDQRELRSTDYTLPVGNGIAP